MVSLNSFPAF